MTRRSKSWRYFGIADRLPLARPPDPRPRTPDVRLGPERDRLAECPGQRRTVAFADVRSLDFNYLEKNLRLTRKDGKTFNFTDRNANADALFVFHKKVEAARTRLSAGVPAAEE